MRAHTRVVLVSLGVTLTCIVVLNTIGWQAATVSPGRADEEALRATLRPRTAAPQPQANVAVCMMGDLRDLAFDRRLWLIWRMHLLSAWPEAQVYTFMHVSLKLRNGKLAELDSLWEMLRWIEPVRLVVSEGDMEVIYMRGEGNPQNSATSPQAFRLKGCYEDMRQFERAQGAEFRFDWFVKTRPDLFMWAPMPPLSALPKDALVLVGEWPKGQEDLFWIINGRNTTSVDLVFDMTSVFDMDVAELAKFTPDVYAKEIKQMTPEAVFDSWRRMQGVAVDLRTDIMLGICRFVEEYKECNPTYHGALFPRSEQHVEQCKAAMQRVHNALDAEWLEDAMHLLPEFNVSTVKRIHAASYMNKDL